MFQDRRQDRPSDDEEEGDDEQDDESAAGQTTEETQGTGPVGFRGGGHPLSTPLAARSALGNRLRAALVDLPHGEAVLPR